MEVLSSMWSVLPTKEELYIFKFLDFYSLYYGSQFTVVACRILLTTLQYFSDESLLSRHTGDFVACSNYCRLPQCQAVVCMLWNVMEVGSVCIRLNMVKDHLCFHFLQRLPNTNFCLC